MFRRTLTCILLLGCFLFLSVPASAQTGSIKIETTGGTVALYKVGEFHTQGFLLYQEYGSGIISEDDVLSSNLAAWLYEQVGNGHIKATDIYGDALFDGLSPGLYLIAQPSTPEGQNPFDPFLLSLPWDGTVWEINIDLELLPQTGETPFFSAWGMGMLISALGIWLCFCCRKWLCT